jgi:hypothetical protein
MCWETFLGGMVQSLQPSRGREDREGGVSKLAWGSRLPLGGGQSTWPRLGPARREAVGVRAGHSVGTRERSTILSSHLRGEGWKVRTWAQSHPADKQVAYRPCRHGHLALVLSPILPKASGHLPWPKKPRPANGRVWPALKA